MSIDVITGYQIQMYIFLLLLVPAIEIWLFISVGQHLGALLTIMLCVVTAGIGLALVRYQGMAALQNLSAQPNKLQTRVAHMMLQGGLLLIAGFCLLIPGFFSDFIGFMLLIPPLREKLSNLMEKRFKLSSKASIYTHGETIIDAEYTVYDEKTPASPKDSPWLSNNNNTL